MRDDNADLTPPKADRLKAKDGESESVQDAENTPTNNKHNKNNTNKTGNKKEKQNNIISTRKSAM